MSKSAEGKCIARISEANKIKTGDYVKYEGFEFFPANLESIELLILRKRETRVDRSKK